MRLPWVAAMAPVMICTVQFAHAQESSVHPYMDNKHLFSLGAIYQGSDGEISASGEGLPENGVDLGDLGLDDSDMSWMFEYSYRISEKWEVIASAYRYSSSNSVTAKDSFNFDGQEFEAGMKLDSDMEVNTYIVDLLYTVYDSDRAIISIGGGLHAFDLSASIKGTLFIGDSQASTSRGNSELLVPLPNLRAYGAYAINSRWLIIGSLGWLSANYDDYEGAYSFARLRASYRITDHFSMSVGYHYTDVDFTRDTHEKEVEFNMEFSGPTVQLSYGF